MTEAEQNEAVGAIANRLSAAKKLSCCLNVKAARLVDDLKVFCDALEAPKPISSLVEDGIQIRKHPGYGTTILEKYIKYPDRAEVLNVIQERDRVLKEVEELQAEWDKVAP